MANDEYVAVLKNVTPRLMMPFIGVEIGDPGRGRLERVAEQEPPPIHPGCRWLRSIERRSMNGPMPDVIWVFPRPKSSDAISAPDRNTHRPTPAARRRGNELLVRVTPKKPSRKPTGSQFRFAVPRRHEQHQPIDFTALDPHLH